MNTWLVISVLFALGLIVGNIMLLKYSAKMKFEAPKQKEKTESSGEQPQKSEDTES